MTGERGRILSTNQKGRRRPFVSTACVRGVTNSGEKSRLGPHEITLPNLYHPLTQTVLTLMKNFHFAANPTELSEKAAEFFIETANKGINQNGRFTVALSGGSTPKLLHQKLVSASLDWKKVFFFFGDERNVPPDRHESNFRMAFETLFHPLNIEHANIYRWQTEIGNPLEVAIDYAFRAATFFEGFPRFDLILLGLGTDGHTASLFPQTEALEESSDIAVANWVDKLEEERFTLTFPLINNAANIAFLVSGKEKAATLKEVIEGEFRPKILPAQSVSPANGTLHWFADKAAASLLQRD